MARILAQIGRADRALADTRREIARLTGEVERYQGYIEESPVREHEYRALETEYESLARLHESFLRRKLESDLSIAAEEADMGEQMHVLDAAHPPTIPIAPDIPKLAGVTLVLALGLGLGVGLVRETLDPTYRGADEIARETGLEVLVSLAEWKPESAPPPARARSSEDGMKRFGQIADEVVVVSDSQSPMAESFRILSGRILFSHSSSRPSSILVTSALPGEGKTFVSVNLAVSLAKNVGPTLLVDCDLRHPCTHGLLGYPNRRGLRDHLEEGTPLDDLVIQTSVPNLRYLPSGPTPSNASELVASDRMADLIAGAVPEGPRGTMVIDTTPAHLTAEPEILRQWVGGILLVVRSGRAPRTAVSEVIESLGRDKLLGIVFNGDPASQRGYHKYYPYYYSSGGAGSGKRRPQRPRGDGPDRSVGCDPGLGPMARGPERPVLLTVDVEEWFQVENLKAYVERGSWGDRDSRVERNVHAILDVLDSGPRPVRGTFFVLGWIAERRPGLVRTIRDRGHEIASHGFDHRLATSIPEVELATDLERCRRALEDATGSSVHGHRAPSFSITPALVDRLRAAGYRYDASYNSFAHHPAYGTLDLAGRPRRGIAIDLGTGSSSFP